MKDNADVVLALEPCDIHTLWIVGYRYGYRRRPLKL